MVIQLHSTPCSFSSIICSFTTFALPLRMPSSHIHAWLPPCQYSEFSFLKRPSLRPTWTQGHRLQNPYSNLFLFYLPRIRLSWLLSKLSYAPLRSFQEQRHNVWLDHREKDLRCSCSHNQSREEGGSAGKLNKLFSIFSHADFWLFRGISFLSFQITFGLNFNKILPKLKCECKRVEGRY